MAVRKLQMVIGKGRTRRGVSLASVTVGAWLVEMCTQTAGARLVALVVRAKSDDGMAMGRGVGSCSPYITWRSTAGPEQRVTVQVSWGHGPRIHGALRNEEGEARDGLCQTWTRIRESARGLQDCSELAGYPMGGLDTLCAVACDVASNGLRAAIGHSDTVVSPVESDFSFQ